MKTDLNRNASESVVMVTDRLLETLEMKARIHTTRDLEQAIVIVQNALDFNGEGSYVIIKDSILKSIERVI